MPCAAGGPDDPSGDVESEPDEHAANTGIMAAAATASTFTLLGVTAHTVAAGTKANLRDTLTCHFGTPHPVSIRPQSD